MRAEGPPVFLIKIKRPSSWRWAVWASRVNHPCLARLVQGPVGKSRARLLPCATCPSGCGQVVQTRQANGAKRTHSAAAFDSSSTEPRLFAHGPPRTNAWGFVRLGCPPADGRRNDGAEPATPSQRAGRINLLFMGRGRAAPDAHLRHRGLGGLWRRIPVTAAWQMCRRIPRACGLAGCDWGAVRKGVGGESGPHSAGQASYQAASAFFS